MSEITKVARIISANQIESDEQYSKQVKLKQVNNFIGKLVSKDNILLIRNKNIQIGRRCSTSEVDFQIGKNKFVSRKHLILTHDEKDFSLTCIGKNGIFVDGIFRRYRKGMPQFKLPKSCVLRFPNTNIRLQFESLETQNMNISIQQDVKTESINSIPNNSETYTINRRQIIQYGSIIQFNATERPPGSYAQFIIEAIQAAPEKQLKLSEIYAYIEDKYDYFRKISKNGWQNSIRHNLSLYQHFVRIPELKTKGSTKGSLWTIDESLLNRK